MLQILCVSDDLEDQEKFEEAFEGISIPSVTSCAFPTTVQGIMSSFPNVINLSCDNVASYEARIEHVEELLEIMEDNCHKVEYFDLSGGLQEWTEDDEDDDEFESITQGMFPFEKILRTNRLVGSHCRKNAQSTELP